MTYHRFGENSSGKISSVDFEKHLEYLSKNFSIISYDEAVLRISEGAKLPPHPVVITIDDGYSDACNIAFKVLQKFGLAGTLFVVTDFVDRRCWLWTDQMRYVLLNTREKNVRLCFDDGTVIAAQLESEEDRLKIASKANSKLKQLNTDDRDRKIREISEGLKVELPEQPPKEFAPITWGQAREMDAAGLRIESHTATHPILTKIDAHSLVTELSSSKRRLEEVLDREVLHFCYPNGDVNDQVSAAVKEARYRSAVTTEFGFNRVREDVFNLKRISAESQFNAFLQNATGFEEFKMKIRKTAGY